MANGSGSRVGALLALLVLLVGAGGANYYRNMKAEQQQDGASRPLKGYDDAGLAALAEAYRAEIKALEARRATMRTGADPASARGAFLGDNAKAFERVQRSSQRLRDVLGEIAERQGRLAEIEKEQQYRSAHAASGGIALHLSRLFGI